MAARRDMPRTDDFGRYLLTPRPALTGCARSTSLSRGSIVRTDGEKQDAGGGPTVRTWWNSGDSVAAFYPRPAPPGSTRRSISGGACRCRPATTRCAGRPACAGPAGAGPPPPPPGAQRGGRAAFDSFGGHLTEIEGEAEWPLGSHLRLELEFERSRVSLPMGSFTANISSLSTRSTPSRRGSRFRPRPAQQPGPPAAWPTSGSTSSTARAAASCHRVRRGAGETTRPCAAWPTGASR